MINVCSHVAEGICAREKKVIKEFVVMSLSPVNGTLVNVASLSWFK